MKRALLHTPAASVGACIARCSGKSEQALPVAFTQQRTRRIMQITAAAAVGARSRLIIPLRTVSR